LCDEIIVSIFHHCKDRRKNQQQQQTRNNTTNKKKKHTKKNFFFSLTTNTYSHTRQEQQQLALRFAFCRAKTTKSNIMTTTKPKRTLFASFTTSETKKQHHFSPRLKGGKDSDLYVAIGVVLMMFFLAFMIAWWNSNTSSRRKSKVR